MADFKTLRTNVTQAAEAVKSNKEKNDTLEQSFIDAMKSWDEAITAIEWKAKTDTTQIDSAREERNNYNAFTGGLEKELVILVDKKDDEVEKITQETNNEIKEVAQEVTKNMATYSIEDLQELKNKPWKELWTDPIYMISLQQMIIDTWAKHDSITDEVLTDGIYGSGTKAGVITLQKHLNKKYETTLVADGLAGPATLQALLEKDGEATRVEKIIKDHSDIVPEVPTRFQHNTSTPSNKAWWEEISRNRKVDIKEANEATVKKVRADKLAALQSNYVYFNDGLLNQAVDAMMSVEPPNHTWSFKHNDITYYFDTLTNTIGTNGKELNEQKEQKEEIEKQKINLLVNYLKTISLSQKNLYPEEEGNKYVKAFFKEFWWGIEFDKNEVIVNEDKKSLTVEFDRRWKNKDVDKDRKIEITENLFNADNTLNEKKLLWAIRKIVDERIQLTNRNYKPKPLVSSKQTPVKNPVKKTETSSENESQENWDDSKDNPDEAKKENQYDK